MASSDYNQRFEEARSKGWDITALTLAGGISVAGALGIREFIRNNKSTQKNDKRQNEGSKNIAGGVSKDNSDTLSHTRYSSDFWDGVKSYKPNVTPSQPLRNAIKSSSAVEYSIAKGIENNGIIDFPFNANAPTSGKTVQIARNVSVTDIFNNNKIYARQLSYSTGGKTFSSYVPAPAPLQTRSGSFETPSTLLRGISKGTSVQGFLEPLAQLFDKSKSKFGMLYGVPGVMAESIPMAGSKAMSLDKIGVELYQALDRTPDSFFEKVSKFKNFNRRDIAEGIAKFLNQATRLSTNKLAPSMSPMQVSIDLSRNLFFKNKNLMTFAINQTDLFGDPSNLDTRRLSSMSSRGFEISTSASNKLGINMVRSTTGSTRGSANLQKNIAGMVSTAQNQKLFEEQGIYLGTQNTTAVAQGLASRLPNNSSLFSFVMKPGSRTDESLQHQILNTGTDNLKAEENLRRMGVAARRGAPIENPLAVAERMIKGEVNQMNGLSTHTDVTLRSAIFLDPRAVGLNLSPDQLRASQSYLHQFKEGASLFGLTPSVDNAKNINRQLANLTQIQRPISYSIPMDSIGAGKGQQSTVSAIMGRLNKKNTLAQNIVSTIRMKGIKDSSENILKGFFVGDYNYLNLKIRAGKGRTEFLRSIGGQTEGLSLPANMYITGAEISSKTREGTNVVNLLGFNTEDMYNTPSVAQGFQSTHSSTVGHIPRELTRAETTRFRSKSMFPGPGLVTTAAFHFDGLKESTKMMMDVSTFLETPTLLSSATGSSVSRRNLLAARQFAGKEYAKIFSKHFGGAQAHFDTKLGTMLQQDLTDEMLRPMLDIAGKADATKMTIFQNEIAKRQRQLLINDKFLNILGLSPVDVQRIMKEKNLPSNQRHLLNQVSMYSYDEIQAGNYNIMEKTIDGVDTKVPYVLRSMVGGIKAEEVRQTVANAEKTLKPGQYGGSGSLKYGLGTASTLMDFYGDAGRTIAQMHLGIMSQGIKAGWVGHSLNNMFGTSSGTQLLQSIKQAGHNVGDIHSFRNLIGSNRLRGQLRYLLNQTRGNIAEGISFADVGELGEVFKSSNKGFLLDLSKIAPGLSLDAISPSSGDMLTNQKSLSEVLIEPLSKLQPIGGDSQKTFFGNYNQSLLKFTSVYDKYYSLAESKSEFNVDTARRELQAEYQNMLKFRQDLFTKKGGAMYELTGGVRYGMSPFQNVQSNATILSNLSNFSKEGNIGLYTMGKGGTPELIDKSMLAFGDTTTYGPNLSSARGSLRQTGYLNENDVFLKMDASEAMNYASSTEDRAMAKKGFLRVGMSKHQLVTRYPEIDRSFLGSVQSIIFDEGLLNKKDLMEKTGLDELKLFMGEGGTSYVDQYLNTLMRGDFDKDKWGFFNYELGSVDSKGQFILDKAKMRSFEIAAKDVRGQLDSLLRSAEDNVLSSYVKNLDKNPMEIYGVKNLTSVETSQMVGVLQEKMNQKTLTGIVNMAMRGRHGPMNDVISNPVLAKSLFFGDNAAFLSPGEKNVMQEVMEYIDLGDILKKGNAIWSGVAEQTAINKGFGSLAIIRAMTEFGGSGNVSDIQSGLIELTIGKNRSPEKIAEVSQQISDLAIKDLRGSGYDIDADILSQVEKELSPQAITSSMDDYLGKVHNTPDTLSAYFDEKIPESVRKNINDSELYGAFSKALVRAQEISSNNIGIQDMENLIQVAKQGNIDIDVESLLASVDPKQTGQNTFSKLAAGLLGLESVNSADLNSEVRQMADNILMGKNRQTASTKKGGSSNPNIGGSGSAKGIGSYLRDFVSAGDGQSRANAFTGLLNSTGEHISKHKLGWGIAGAAVGSMAIASTLDFLGGSDAQISEAPLPRRLPLDEGVSTPAYDMSPIPSVQVAGELPSINSTNIEYNGGDVSGALLTASSGISDLSSTIIRDDTSFFNRQTMNMHREQQNSRRF